MLHIRITFFNTVIRKFGDYELHQNVSEKCRFEFSYNTDSHNRALSYATRRKNKIRAKNPSVGYNARIEFITK